MSSIYTNNGDEISTHCHKLKRINEPPYRWVCVECNTHLQRKSGVVIKGGEICVSNKSKRLTSH